MQTRVRKLRAHHELAAKALRNKIEMRINRVPKRLWNRTLRDIQEELRTGKPALSAVKSADASRVRKAPIATKSTLKRSPVKLALAKPATTRSVPSFMAGTAASPIRQAPKTTLNMSPTKPLYPTITESTLSRSPTAASRDPSGTASGTRSRAGTRTTKATTVNSTTTTTKVVKKSDSNSSLTKSKPASRPTSAASTTGTANGTTRRVGRPPKVKTATDAPADPEPRRPVTRNLRSRA